jgi:meckelin
MLLILEGFNAQLLGSPIPSGEFIDVGKTYKVLRFAFSSFLWLIFMAFEFFVNLLVWKVIGNPFLNFIDLCATANVSVLMLNTPTSGFYIHGRSVHPHTETDMIQLNENICHEAGNMVGLRGLVPNTNDQVFKLYLSVGFAYGIRQGFRAVEEQFSRKAIAQAKQRDSRASPETRLMAAFDPLNRDLRKFFEGSESTGKYVVQSASFAEQLLGLAPQVANDSVLKIHGSYSYRESLIVGIEWGLSAMYLMLFAGVDMETKSPSIAAFVVFFVDLAIVRIFEYLTGRSLAKKGIIDSHFILG